MKKISALFLAATLALTATTSAQAHWERHDGYRDYGYRDYGHHDHHRGGPGWIGPAAVLAITGLAVGAAVASHSYYAPAPAPVYAAPEPVYVAPRPANYGTWYYCGSSGQYYPYTNVCPEGWQAVPAR